MRNASKNTIKLVMRNANRNLANGTFFPPRFQNEHTAESAAGYFLFNAIGAQIYRMSKGKICNRDSVIIKRYFKKNLSK